MVECWEEEMRQTCPETGVPGKPCERDCDWSTGCKRQIERAIRAEAMVNALVERVREANDESRLLRAALLGRGLSDQA